MCLNCACVTVAFHVLYHKKISYTFYCIADFYKHPVTILNRIAHIRKTARYLYFVCTPFWSMLNSSFCVLRIIIKYHSTNTKAHDRYHPCHTLPSTVPVKIPVSVLITANAFAVICPNIAAYTCPDLYIKAASTRPSKNA